MLTYSVNMKRPGQKLCQFPAFLLAAAVCCYAASRNNRMIVEPPKKPININCVTNASHFYKQYTICSWDEAGSSHNTTYRVTMEQENNYGHCTSQLGQKCCRLSEHPTTFKENMTVTVTAQNSFGNASATVNFNSWEIQKHDPPKGIQVMPKPTSLRVEWNKISYGYSEDSEECEAQCVEEGTNVKIVSHKTTRTERDIVVDDVKPCTRYTVVVRCSYLNHGKRSLWSDWSTGSNVTTTLDVSTAPFYLWGKVLKQYTNRTRCVQLMWKIQGLSPFCEAIDEYTLYVDSVKVECLVPTQHYTTVLLDAAHHDIMIAAYKDKTMLQNITLKISLTGKDMPPVQRPIATARDGLIHVSWGAPSTPVKYYFIEWFTDPTEADRPSWDRIQDTNISFPGDLPYKLYTVTITPLYDDGPGQRSTIHTYAKQGAPAKVKQLKKTDGDSTRLTVEWEAVRPDQCCAVVISYTVFYRASAESRQRQLNVTVNHTMVTLRGLHTGTTYQVHVRANSIDNSSDSEPFSFKTEAYGIAFIMTLVYVMTGLISLLVLAVGFFMLRRKVLNLMVPNPQFSSMAMWTPGKSLKLSVSNNLAMENNPQTDSIVLCQVDTEMDPKLASPANTDFILPHPMDDCRGSSIVAPDTSANSEMLLVECQIQNPDEAAAPIHQQPNQISPASLTFYVDQMPVCGTEGPLTGHAQGPGMSDWSIKEKCF